MMLKHALRYMSRGKSIIPVGQNKIPLIDWKEYQSRIATEEEIKDWWQKFPNANIGLVTGVVSGVAVVDIERGGSTYGLPITLTARTGGGGWHLYYKYKEGIDNKTRIKELIDIRGNGGYVVIAPSIHASGNRYEWVNEEPIADFPVEFFDIHKKNDWKEIIKGVPQGNRNETAAKLLGKLMGTFHPSEWENTVRPMLESWNQSNTPPLSEMELKSIYNSISKRAINDTQHTVTETEKDIFFIPFNQMLKNAKEEINSTNAKHIVSFGYEWLDEKLTGLFPSELVVVGGESGSGKTTFATNIIYKASKDRKCAIFALEDRLNDYTIKALYFEINKVKKEKYGKETKNYSWNVYRKNVVKDKEYPAFLEQAEKNLQNENIFFADVDAGITIEKLEKNIEEKVNEGFELFLIDHLHYFDLLRGNSSKADYIEQTMVRIRRLQIRTGARIILVVHYRKLDGKKPTLDSFKDSASIAQNANYVINLWRDRSSDNEEKRYETTFFIPKTRNPNGEGQIQVVFDPITNDYSAVDDWQFGHTPNTEEEELSSKKLFKKDTKKEASGHVKEFDED